MEEIVVHGGRPLYGAVRVNGAKNAALPIMAAVLLTEGPTVLHRVPRLRDVETMAGILRGLGVSVEWTGPESLRLSPGRRDATAAPFDLVRQMRASICVLGPLLAGRGAALLPLPGGCVLGPRPIDLHLKGLRALGAAIRCEESQVRARAGRLRGARVRLAGPHGSTATGTANVMMAAALAEGRTVIEEAACEPEVQDLARFLNECGARIGGVGTQTLTIDGVEGLRGTEYGIIPDRIEAGTFLAAAAVTGGEVRVEGVRPDHMQATIGALTRIGTEIRHGEGTLTASRSAPLKAASLATSPYPGVSTDMQPQLSVLLCLARGRSTVREGVYPCRFTHVAELNRMGAGISRGEGRAVIEGVAGLQGAPVRAADLRAGAALVLAGLAARGTTVITGVDQIDRGYQALEERLGRLGADVQRREGEADQPRQRKSA